MDEKKSNQGSFAILAGSVAILTVYIFSPIPVYIACESIGLVETAEPILAVLYFPLQWLYDHVPAVTWFYNFQAKAAGR